MVAPTGFCLAQKHSFVKRRRVLVKELRKQLRHRQFRREPCRRHVRVGVIETIGQYPVILRVGEFRRFFCTCIRVLNDISGFLRHIIPLRRDDLYAVRQGVRM